MHKLFLGHCVEMLGSEICPSQVLPIHQITHDMLGDWHRVMGDTILGINDIAHSFRGGTCFKVGATFFCADDIPELMRTGCMQAHMHDSVHGHAVLPICEENFVKLLYGEVIDINGQMVKAHFSSDFNDLSHECI